MITDLRNRLNDLPLGIRIIPFAIFLALTLCQGSLGEASRYWFYLIKTIVGIGMLAVIWPLIAEMKWAWSWEALVVGIGVCVMWIALDPFYPQPLFGSKPTEPQLPWNPLAFFSDNLALAWLFVTVRILGSTFVVPPFEEVFYRSFLYRYIVNGQFLTVPFKQFSWLAFLVAAAIFGFNHHQWLAGILCAFAYQGLVLRKNRLGDAMTAHAITNFLLGIYVVFRGAWQFW